MRQLILSLVCCFLLACASTFASTSSVTFQGTATVETPDEPAHDSILTQLADIVARLIGIEAKIDALNNEPPSLSWDPIDSVDLIAAIPDLPAPRSTPTDAAMTITQTAVETFAQFTLRVRSEKSNVSGPGPIYAILKPGMQQLLSGHSLGSSDSGTEVNPIIYTSTPDQWSSLSATLPLDAGSFNPVQSQAILARLHPDIRSNVVQYDMSTVAGFDPGSVTMLLDEGTWPQQLDPNLLSFFFGHQRMPIAQWPNTGMDATIGALHPTDPATFAFYHDRGGRWEGETDMYIQGQFQYDYAVAYAPVESIDPVGKWLKIKPYAASPIYHEFGFKPGQPYRVLNALSELDVPGEWYLDRATNILYFYPPSAITDQSIQVSANSAIMLNVVSANWVTFDSVILEGGRSILLATNTVKHFDLTNSVLRNGGQKVAFRYNLDSSDSQVINNQFYNIASSAIHVVNVPNSYRETLTSTNLVFRHNLIWNVSQEEFTVGLLLYGVGNTFEHNEMRGSPWTGMQVSGNNHLIQCNIFEDLVKEAGDAGAVYAGRDWTVRGHTVRYNYFKNIGQSSQGVNAVYLDDGVSGWTIYGNIFEGGDRGIQLGGGRDHRIENNIFLNTKWDIYMDARYFGNDMTSSAHYTKWQALPTQTPPWSTQYPELVNIMDEAPGSPLNNEVNSNIFLGSGIFQSEGGAQAMIQFLNNRDDTDAGYSLSINSQYQLDAASLASFPEFQQIPFSQIGRITDGGCQTMPTIKPVFGAVLDTGHAHAANLVGAYLFNKGSGDVATDSNGGYGNATVVLSPPTWTTPAAPDLTAMDFSGSTNKGLLTANSPITSSNSGYTVITRVIPDDVTTQRAIFSFALSGDADYDTFELQSGKARAATRIAGSIAAAESTTTLEVNTAYTLAARYDSNSLRSIFVNGTNEDTDATAKDTVTWTKNGIGYLARNTPALGWDGEIVFLYIYNVALSDATIAAISADPYAMFAPQGRANDNIAAIRNSQMITKLRRGMTTGRRK